MRVKMKPSADNSTGFDAVTSYIDGRINLEEALDALVLCAPDDRKNQNISFLRILFSYMDGELSLDEAVNDMRATGYESTETTLRHLLLKAPRFNVFQLHEQGNSDKEKEI